MTWIFHKLNKVIESIEYASDAYWGDPERFRFKALIDSFTTATELTTGRDRLVKGTFNIRLRGYIIPDTVQKDMTAITKYNSDDIVYTDLVTGVKGNYLKPSLAAAGFDPENLPQSDPSKMDFS